jgi:hypothetical protein
LTPGAAAGRNSTDAERPPSASGPRGARGYEGTNVFTFDWALAGRASLARGEYRLRIVEYDLGRRIGERRRRFGVR